MKLIEWLFDNKKAKTMSPQEFIEKFVKDSRKKHVQLELYKQEYVILQLESLRHVPIWINWANVDRTRFENGFVCHFFVKKEDVDGPIYQNCISNQEVLGLIEYEDETLGIINFMYFFEKNINPIEIGKYMKKVIEKVYVFPEKNPQIGFNLRYLKQK